MPSPQPGVTVVSKNYMCNKKVVAHADPATRHGNLALHQGSDDDVILGSEGGGSKPTDRHRPQGRFFVNDTEDAQNFVNTIKNDDFTSQPSWLKGVGEQYSTSIRYLNIQGNKTHKLSRFLLEARESGCAFACVSSWTRFVACIKSLKHIESHR